MYVVKFEFHVFDSVLHLFSFAPQFLLADLHKLLLLLQLFFDLGLEGLDAHSVDVELDAGLHPVLPKLFADIEDPDNGFADLDVFLYRYKVVESQSQTRHDGRASAYQHLEALSIDTILVSLDLGNERHVVDCADNAVASAAGERNLHLAGQFLGERVAHPPTGVGRYIRADVKRFFGRDPGNGATDDVSHRVATGLTAAKANFAQAPDDFYVVFNFDAIDAIIRAFENNQAGGAVSGSNTKDASSLLQSLTNIGVVCVFDGKGFGSQWFAYRLGKAPPSRQPSFSSKDRIVSAFKTVLLQEIAVSDGAIYGVDSSYSYLQRVDEMVSGLLYDSYLKHLVNTATKPDSSDVKGYYHNNKEEKYLESEKVVIRDLRVSYKFLADSLLMVAADGADFSLLASNFSSINPKDGGLYGPFARNNNKSLFDAASLLGVEEIGPVLPVSNNQFSIIQLVERIPQKPIELSRVYARIESLLIKENQNNAKTGVVDELHKKYNIEKNLSLLVQ